MSNIKLFENKKIRSIWDANEEKWYFSVQDVVEVLTDSKDVKQYIKKMLQRDSLLKSNWGTICTLVKMEAADGKSRDIQASDTKGLLRIIQSIPSAKAEPFKLWLAEVCSDRLREIEDPELATRRSRELYRLKGYSEDWIEKRMRSIAIREELTEEWKGHGINHQIEYSILTAEISKVVFGVSPSQHKTIKSLKSQNLRDHMTDLELIFSMLGEASTKEIVINTNPIGLETNVVAAKSGGKIAGDARRQLEAKTGKSVVSGQNYLSQKVSKRIGNKDEQNEKE